jgi:hypothetical protein
LVENKSPNNVKENGDKIATMQLLLKKEKKLQVAYRLVKML